MAHNILPPGSPDFSQSQQMSCIALTESKMQMETTQHLKTTSKAHYVLHGTSLSRPKMDTRGRHRTPQVFHLQFGRACINKVGGAISNYCTPPCAAAQLLSLSSVFVTKWTVRRDDGHQLQVRADQRKVRGAVLIYYARQQADHQGTQVVSTCSQRDSLAIGEASSAYFRLCQIVARSYCLLQCSVLCCSVRQ